jgi:hypothetical protein
MELPTKWKLKNNNYSNKNKIGGQHLKYNKMRCQKMKDQTKFLTY